MTRKRRLTYGLLGVLLVALAGLIYFYQEYLGEDPDADAEATASPIIKKRLKAVVLRTATVRNGNQPKLEVAYTDMGTGEGASFTVDDQYRQSIHIGDTLTKEKGEKLLLVYQKRGKIDMVPLD